jgi:hypothetical protein
MFTFLPIDIIIVISTSLKAFKQILKKFNDLLNRVPKEIYLVLVHFPILPSTYHCF